MGKFALISSFFGTPARPVERGELKALTTETAIELADAIAQERGLEKVGDQYAEPHTAAA